MRPTSCTWAQWGYGILSGSLKVGSLLMSGKMIMLPPVNQAGRFLLGSVASFGLARSFPDAVVAYAPVVAAMTAGIPSLRRHRTDEAARNEDTEMAAG